MMQLYRGKWASFPKNMINYAVSSSKKWWCSVDVDVVWLSKCWSLIFISIFSESFPNRSTYRNKNSEKDPTVPTATLVTSCLLCPPQPSRCTSWRLTKPASGGSSPSTSSPSTSRARAASAAATSSCGCGPKTWRASVPRSKPARSTCCWGMTRTPPARAAWWQTKEVWWSSGGTRGRAGSGSFSSVRRKASARSLRRRRESRPRERRGGQERVERVIEKRKEKDRAHRRTRRTRDCICRCFLCLFVSKHEENYLGQICLFCF